MVFLSRLFFRAPIKTPSNQNAIAPKINIRYSQKEKCSVDIFTSSRLVIKEIIESSKIKNINKYRNVKIRENFPVERIDFFVNSSKRFLILADVPRVNDVGFLWCVDRYLSYCPQCARSSQLKDLSAPRLLPSRLLLERHSRRSHRAHGEHCGLRRWQPCLSGATAPQQILPVMTSNLDLLARRQPMWVGVSSVSSSERQHFCHWLDVLQTG